MAYTINLAPSGHEFVASDQDNLLKAAQDAGIALPYGCLNGACRSCRAQVLAGRISYPDGPPKALMPQDEIEGFTLLCCAHPDSDLELHVDEFSPDQKIEVRTLPVRVKTKRMLAHDVVQLTLELREGEELRYVPGQYVDILLRDGRRRAFSIANAARADNTLELHIRWVVDGAFSSYVAEHMKERSLLRLRGPLGSFFLRNEPPMPSLLVAGGTGLAPIKSMVEDALIHGRSEPMYIYWGVRAMRDLYLHETMLEWAAGYDNVSYTPVLSEEPQATGSAWTGRTGFVHTAVLEDFDDLSGFEAYLSGPPPMVNAGRASFIERGLNPANLHADSFEHAFETGHEAVAAA
ncbi:MAG: 2Fe-2S iron-sulfur cluster-binding protein [Gammaproteobacteria bacterium]